MNGPDLADGTGPGTAPSPTEPGPHDARGPGSAGGGGRSGSGAGAAEAAVDPGPPPSSSVPAGPVSGSAVAAGTGAITVVYDEQCELCRRCRHWLAARRTHVPVRFIAAGSPEARRRWPDVEWLGVELVVVGDAGQLWVGPAAFLVCLWATVQYRPWSYRLASPAMAPLARGFVHRVSKERHRFGRTVTCSDGTCAEAKAPRTT
jgi:predicted DCC family thiol-disulfide oxidoreductase YuxK